MKSEKSKYEQLDQALNTTSQNNGEKILESVEENSQLSLLDVATWLKERRSLVEPRAGFLAADRKRLISALGEQNRSNKQWGLSWQGKTIRLAIAGLMVFCILLMSNGVALAAESAMPGDGLYPVKTLVEDARLMLSLDEVRDAELQIEYAQQHLVDCASLLAEERYEDALIALHNYDKYIIAATRSVSSIEDSQVASELSRSLSETLLQNTMIIQYLLSDIQ